MSKINKEDVVQEEKRGKALKVVYLRNRFFYMFYQYAMLAFITSTLMFIASLFFMLYFINRPVPPQFVLVDAEGKYVELTPVSQCYSAEEISAFVIEAITKTYRHDYYNYASQLQEAVPYFTNQGWNAFLTQYTEARTLDAIKANKWIVSASVDGVPVIMDEYLDSDGYCMWDVKVPITIRYIGPSAAAQNYEAYIRLTRTSILRNERGVAIMALVLVAKK